MKRITARFSVSTPMFLGGADNTNTAEIRAFSVRGVLRFWWRALAWCRHADDIKAMHEEESRLFGSADQNFGQGAFLMKLDVLSGGETIEKRKVPFGLEKMDGARYLGYGIIEAFGSRKKQTSAGELLRPCIAPPTIFEMQLLFKGSKGDQKNLCEKHVQQICDALKAMGLFGGLGSRSRKGFGSLTLLSLEDGDELLFKRPETSEEYSREVKTLLSEAQRAESTPTFSAFNAASRVDMLAFGKDPLRLLDETGRMMQLYRSYGNKGRVGRFDAERNFQGDHDLFYAQAKRGNATTHPQRVAFGLPHNYYSGNLKTGMQCEPERATRRASPLFLHVHEYGVGLYAVTSLILSSQFLPKDMKVKLQSKAGSSLAQQAVDYRVLYGFLEGYRGARDNKTDTPYFPERKQVTP